MTTSLFGRPGNNPYCHHRALEMQRLGKRERVVRASEAPGLPFDHARWELVVEESAEASRESLVAHLSCAEESSHER
jgi:hypothetical protein